MAVADIQLTRERVGDIASVLSRHGFDTRKGKILCPNPEHRDKRPGSVVILPPGTRGTETIYCHACHYSDDNIGLARLLGETVVFPRRSDQSFVPRRFRTWRRPRTRKQIQRATRLRRVLEVDGSIELEWRFARKVAELFFEPGAVQLEIDRNRDWLEDEGCNIQRIQTLTDKLAHYAFETHGNDNQIDDRHAWRSWIAKSVKELEA